MDESSTPMSQLAELLRQAAEAGNRASKLMSQILDERRNRYKAVRTAPETLPAAQNASATEPPMSGKNAP